MTPAMCHHALTCRSPLTASSSCSRRRLPRVGARMWMSASGPSAGATPRQPSAASGCAPATSTTAASPFHETLSGTVALRERRAACVAVAPCRPWRRRTSRCRSRAARCRRCSPRRTRPRPSSAWPLRSSTRTSAARSFSGPAERLTSVPKSIWPPSIGPERGAPFQATFALAAAAHAPDEHREGDGESADRAAGHACCNAGAGANLRSAEPALPRWPGCPRRRAPRGRA